MRTSSRAARLSLVSRVPPVLALALAFTCLAVATASADTGCTVYWTGGAAGDSSWSNEANWSADPSGATPRVAAGAEDDVCMATDPVQRTLSTDTPVEVGAVHLGPTDVLEVVSPLTIGSVSDSSLGHLHVRGLLTKAAGSRLDVQGTFTLAGTLIANGAVAVIGDAQLNGQLDGDVALFGHTEIIDFLRARRVVNEGTLEIGASAGSSPVQLSGAGTSTPSLINKGTITIEPNSDSTSYLGEVDNQGLIEAGDVFVQFYGLHNLSDGVLSGPGEFAVHSAGLMSFGGPVERNEATLRNRSQGSFSIEDLYGLTENAGTLDVGSRTPFGADLVNTGTVKVGAPLSMSGYSQTAGSTVGTGGTLFVGGDASITGGSVEGLRVEGDLTLGSGATTKVVVDGDGNTNPVAATGALALGGTLQVDTDTSFVPPATSEYPVAVANTRSGSFDAVQAEAPTRFYVPIYSDSAARVRAEVQPALALQPDTVNVSESSGTASLTVSLDGARDVPVTVDWATHDGSAQEGTDYDAASGTLTFQPGETTKPITVPLLDDAGSNPTRSFEVRLDNPRHGQIEDGHATATVTIVEDAPPTLGSVEGGPVRQGATNQLLTLHGHGFTAATEVTFARVGLKATTGSLTILDDQTLTVRVNAASGMRPGLIGTSVSTGTRHDTCPDCLVVVSRPLATATSPGVLGAGASHQNLTVTGSGFVEGAAVTIAGAVVHATSYVSANELRVTFSVPSTRLTGVASLRVVNPDGGRHTCNTCASFVAAPRLDPANALAVRRSSTQTIHLLGSGFVDGLTLSAPPGVTFTDLVVTPSGITATMSVAATTRLAPDQKLTVTNPASAGWGTTFGTFLSVCTRTAPSCGS